MYQRLKKFIWQFRHDLGYSLQGVKNICIDFFIKTPEIQKIPIIINNRNRYTFLLQLIESLEVRGYRNIIILDNASTYEPLMKYYEQCPYRVIALHGNLGFKALENIDEYRLIRRGYYVYTDPDVVLIEECPVNFLDTFLGILKKHPTIMKVGFSLKIDDLPDYYENKQKVIDHEKQYWTRQIEDNVYLGHIDTTFALHRPYSRISIYFSRMARVGFPYSIRHLPWYVDSNNLSEEEKYYIEHATIGGHWTNGDPMYNVEH